MQQRERLLDLLWLDQLQSSIYHRAATADASAINAVLGIMELRAKLVGL